MNSSFFNLKLAWRNIIKRKGYSFINIMGLATGLAICMMIVLFIRNELSYEIFIPNKESICRMVVDRKYPGRTSTYSMIPQSYAGAMKMEYPEVKAAVRLYEFLGGNTLQLQYDEKKFEERSVLFADSTFFEVFHHPLIAGDSHTALNLPHSMVMTESTAIRYFGSAANALDKIIKQESRDRQPEVAPLIVKGVCKDWPENSHFDFDILMSTSGNDGFKQENFVNFSAHTYLLLEPNASMIGLENKIPSLIKKYAAGNIAKAFALPFDDFTKAGNGYHYYFQPLAKIHLISHMDGELKPNGSIQAIYIFGAIAFIILILAIINFVNLATARSSERAREVGIRKTYGSDKRTLITQFLTESLLVSVLALAVAIGLVYMLLPYFNQFSNGNLHFNELWSGNNIALFASLSVLTGILAGLYPALVLSGFRPITVLKGKFTNTSQGMLLRNGLVVFQFAISIILIICTLIVNQQMKYMTGNTLGYNKELTVLIKRTDLLNEHAKAFKADLTALPIVEKVSNASAYPGDNNYFGISWRQQGNNQPMTGRGLLSDDQYASTFNLPIKEGRYFSKEYGTDSLAVVLNEAAVKELGLTDPIGKNLTTEEDFLNGAGNQQYVYHVIGVVKDYNYQSLHLPITPLVITNTIRFNDVTNSTAIKIKPGDVQNSLKQIEGKWNQYIKDRPFAYEFLDQTIARQYQSELRTQKVFTFFASLAIFIACIGLFGLAAYTCQQRMREISVRKVLGASVSGIVGLLSKNFIKLIFIASVIAMPIAWYLMHRWLQDFSYRVHISWSSFAIAMGVSLAIAFVTLSFQTIRAGMANPVTSLRSE